MRFQAQKIMGKPSRTIHIDRTTESLCQKDDALCLVGSGGLVYYELLKPVETINTKRYQQQLTDLNRPLLERISKRSRTERGNTKLSFFMTMLHHIPIHTKLVRNTSEAFSRKVLRHAPYSPDLTPSDYHLFASMGHALPEQCFSWFEDGSGNDSQQMGKIFTGMAFTNCPKDGKNI